jgi:hypothetical protein
MNLGNVFYHFGIVRSRTKGDGVCLYVCLFVCLLLPFSPEYSDFASDVYKQNYQNTKNTILSAVLHECETLCLILRLGDIDLEHSTKGC